MDLEINNINAHEAKPYVTPSIDDGRPKILMLLHEGYNITREDAEIYRTCRIL